MAYRRHDTSRSRCYWLQHRGYVLAWVAPVALALEYRYLRPYGEGGRSGYKIRSRKWPEVRRELERDGVELQQVWPAEDQPVRRTCSAQKTAADLQRFRDMCARWPGCK